MGLDRVFLFAVAVSAFVHLSMITLFSIEMSYERTPMKYYAFDIVNVGRLTEDPLPEARAQLSLPVDPNTPFGSPGAVAAAGHLETLPKITLPVLGFEETGAIGFERTGIRLDAPYAPLLKPGPRDAWARFGEGIQELRGVLRRLPFLEGDTGDEVQAGRALQPAPGYTARISWIGEPSLRKVIFSPSIGAQWLTAAPLKSPIQIVFRVDADGRVVEVLTPVGEKVDIVEGAVEALRRFRFEPLPEGRSGEQAGTYTLAPEDLAP